MHKYPVKWKTSSLRALIGDMQSICMPTLYKILQKSSTNWQSVILWKISENKNPD